MKKTISLVLAVIMLLFVAGCGTTSPSSPTATSASAKPITITYVTLGGTGNDLLKQAAKDFKAKTNITVNLQDWSYTDAAQKILTLAEGKNPPDCMYGFSSWIQQFKAAGYTVALDSYISKNLYNDFSAAARNICSVDGKLWALPSYMSIRSMLFNTNSLKAAGIEKVPTTWEEFLAIAPKLTDSSKNKYAYSMVAGDPKNTLDCWLPILWAYDGDIISADGKKNGFNNPEGVAALQMYVDLSKYAVPDFGEANIDTTQSNFTNQIAAAYFHNAQGLAALRDAKKDYSWATVAQPLAGPKGSKYALGVMDVDLLFKTSNDREVAAGKWLEYWHNIDREGLVIEQAGWVPNQTSFLKRPSFIDPSNVMVAPFVALEPIAKFEPVVVAWEEIQKDLSDAVTKAVMGKMSATDALASAGKQVDALLAKK
jgi:multiple sugar transport system substrate-binding protein